MRKASRLRRLFQRSQPLIAVGAHDALSARLIEEAGFDAVWASGFGISTVNALPDASILTMTEDLEAVKKINNAVSIPVIADCDTGYGNAINVMRTVAEYEKEGLAGICIEDNVFPKRCSFYPGVKRDLVTAEEHARKIEAAKAAQREADFMVIARTEALIAGWGMQDALARARAYAAAGADAVLVHSKASSFDELREFASHWEGSVPLVAVPTTFPRVTVEEIDVAGFRMVIFANHPLRAAITAMQDVLRLLHREKTPWSVESRIAPLPEVYRLVGLADLQAKEKRFLVSDDRVTAIIIAAGFEEELMPLIRDRPKGMLDIKGRTILERQVHALHVCGVTDIVVVRGYRKEYIHLPHVRYYDNDRFRETGEVSSLFLAEREMAGGFVFLYGDIIFDPAILEKLLRMKSDIGVVVDRAWYDTLRNGGELAPHRADLVVTDKPPVARYRFLPPEEATKVIHLGQNIPPQAAHGEFIGMAQFSEHGAQILRRVHAEAAQRCRSGRFHETETFAKASLTDLLQEVIDQGYEVRAVDIYKGWMEIDTFDDYRRAWAEVKK